MKNLYIFELNEIYQNQVRLPYSTGLIWSYCKKQKNIIKNYSLKNWFFYKQEINDILKEILNPDVIIISCSIWNWELNCEVIKNIKLKYPECLVICGGPQVPHNDKFIQESEEISPYWGFPIKDWFKYYPYFDIISSGEGEITISELLQENLKKLPDFKKIKGCIINQSKDIPYVTEIRDRISDIDSMPSPYLDGSFDNLLTDNFNYTATIETTRGCPFHCTYCDQGRDYFNRIKSHSLEKIKSEIKWCSDNKIVYLENADSNFGMLYERDIEISKFLVERKLKTGYPKYYSATWAKSKTMNNIQIMKILQKVDLDSRGVDMAFQSMNENTLKNIMRKNMNLGTTKKTIESLEKENIGAFVELILGLPGETKESFLDGIFEILEAGHHKFIGIYPLQVLPNTLCADSRYVKTHELQIKKTKSHAAYIIPSKHFSEDMIVVSTKDMTYEDWIESFIYKVLIVGCHSYGPTQYFSRYLRKNHNISYKEFYTKLFEWSTNNPKTILGIELMETKKSLIDAIENKKHWNRLLPEADFTWVDEEALAIQITKNKKKFYDEVIRFVEEIFDIKLDDSLITHQYFSISDPNVNYPITINNITYKLNFQRENFNGNYLDWAKECIWWGRKGSKYLTKCSGDLNKFM